jgi:hypothetical protein
MSKFIKLYNSTGLYRDHAEKIATDLLDKTLTTVPLNEYQYNQIKETMIRQIVAYVANYGEEENDE